MTNKFQGLHYIKFNQNILQLVIFTYSLFTNNKNMFSQIDYVICLAIIINKANIIY